MTFCFKIKIDGKIKLFAYIYYKNAIHYLHQTKS